MIAARNPVLIALFTTGAIGIGQLGFVSLAPNRLLSGRPIALWHACDSATTATIVAVGLAFAATALIRPTRRGRYASLALAGILAVLFAIAAGRAASTLSTPDGLARIAPGGGFWLGEFCAAMAIVDSLQRLRATIAIRALTVVVAMIVFVALSATGIFDALSLAQEYRSHHEAFAAEFVRHLMLVLGSMAPSLVIGVPLGVAALRNRRLGEPLFGALNVLQTIPSIALFALLIGPLALLAAAIPSLAGLGIGGIGVAPAVIALTLYALLPIVRYTHAGLAAVDGGVIDSARAMGMTPGQVFRRVEVPLALPTLMTGLRIVMVQSIGLAVVAALIGAGGLGSFVFQGIGQGAVDLVLLGTLPTIALALVSDFMLRVGEDLLRRRVAR